MVRLSEVVLANTVTKFLLRQDPSVIDKLRSVMHLNQEERNLLLTAKLGGEILFTDGEQHHMKVVSSEKEHALITTKADELA